MNFVDDIVRDILTALRSFGRAPLHALTIVATVALGLGFVAVVFTVFNAFFFRADAVRNPGELFTVQRVPHAGANVWIPFTRPEYEALRRETSLFTDAFGTMRGLRTRIDGRAMNGTLVTGNFFQVLGIDAAAGRTLTPADDERFNRLVIVLSHRGWTKLFADDTVVSGSSVLVNGTPAEIVGVMPENFRGLALGAPDYWAPLALAGQIRPTYAAREDQIAIDVVGRLKPGISPQAATAGLSLWASARADPDAAGGRPAFFRLRPNRGTVGDDARGALMAFLPLFFAFGLILLIGCANVANLLLARGVSRQREIGIRLSLGAPRRRVVRQLLTESLLLALAAAACALAVSRVLLETSVHLVVATMPPEFAEQVSLAVPPVDWRVLAFLLGGAIVSTAFFGLAPALQATRLELVRTMRGELVRDSRPGRAGNALIMVQVTASALLLICAAVFLRSAFAASSENPGVRTSDTVVVDIENEPLRAAMLQALASHPAVAAVAASSPHAFGLPWSTFAEAAETSRRVGLGYRFVSPDYFGLLDIDVLRGRGFTGGERAPDAGVVVVSESTARRLWPDRDAVGQVVRLESWQTGARPLGAGSPATAVPSRPLRTFTVVGVVRDVRSTLRGPHPSDAVAYLPASPETAGTSLTLRVHGDPAQARQALIELLTAVDPAVGTIMTMRTMAGLEAYILRIAFAVTVVLGGLALVLTLSGLFSVLSYIIEQRTREIGVRMALGATTRNVARLVLSQSARPVAFGLIAGAALAAGLATVLMTTPAAAQIGNTVHVLDPVAYASSICCIIIACVPAALIPALRAAHIDPIATLRQD